MQVKTEGSKLNIFDRTLQEIRKGTLRQGLRYIDNIFSILNDFDAIIGSESIENRS